MLRTLLITSLLTLALPLCAQAETPFAVEDAYARAVPPGQPNSAAFMHITNPSDQDRALVGAESSVSQVAELHNHIMEDGMMKMRKVDRIELPAGTTQSLQPGGYHIMLIGLNENFQPDGEVQLTLHFDQGEDMQINAPIRRLEMKMMNQDKHMH